MDLSWISLGALLIVIVVSCTTAVNPGLLSIVFAWLIGVWLAPALGQDIGGFKGVLAGFPVDVFLTLVGVTWLFTQAHVNGTLERLAAAAVRLCRGNLGMVPVMFFLLAAGLGSIGPGNIATAALMAPIAMAVAARAGIPPFLMTIMVAHGATASSLSPFAPTGVVVAGLMQRMELGGHEWRLYFNNLLANAVVAFGGYFLFGGWRLFFRSTPAAEDRLKAELPTTELECERNGSSEPHPHPGPLPECGESETTTTASATAFQPSHVLTLLVIAGLVASVIFGRVHVGMGAFVGAALLSVLRLADERKTMQAMPWNVIIMVCGVTMLTSMLQRTGGLDLFSTLLARFSNQQSITGIVALVTGLISVYSSTSGVVLPTFLPSIPGLVTKLGGGDPLAIASSMAVGGHLVDTSPLSTIGALCVAGVPATQDRRKLFNQVMAWGLSMALVGAVVSYICFGLLNV